MNWAIVAKDSPEEVIGIIGFRLKEKNGDNRGFWLAEPYWGRGYMTEAVTATQDFLFFELGIDRFVVSNAKSNIGSRRVKEKTGARFLEHIEMEHHEGGSDSEKWEVTREAWEKLRAGKYLKNSTP